MRHTLGFLVLAVSITGLAQDPGKSRNADGKTSLTGCVDERNGQYVLAKDTNMGVIARLQPTAGSPDDNFARYVGNKVTVRGKLSQDDTPPIMSVEGLTRVSQACGSTPGVP
jgi:hypothetical protein